MSAKDIFSSVLKSALIEIREKSFPIYTFALYHDHESAEISVCADTLENSAKFVVSSNNYRMKYFSDAIIDNDLKAASLWQANIGRSLSLGDFVLQNVARTELGKIRPNKVFYLNMIKSIMAMQDEIASLSLDPKLLLFASSGPNYEVECVWSMVEPNPLINRACLRQAGQLGR